MKRLIALLVVFGWSVACWAADGNTVAALSTIIETVRRNELLYANLDVNLQAKYEDFHEHAGPGTESSVPSFKVYRRSEDNTHFVSQRGMFRTNKSVKGFYVDNSPFEYSQVRMFDGQTTLAFNSPATGNIIRGRSEGSMMRPHMLLLLDSITAPLSTYLQGHKAMAASPDAHWDKRHLGDAITLENTYQGETTFQGLKCHKVWITEVLSNGYQHDRWELWLAEARNFIPVRMLSYTFRFSKDIPVSKGEVTQWRELKPGVWFPSAAKVTTLDMLVLQREGKQTPGWERTYAVQDVSLEPTHDVAFFRDLKFPKGTHVYEVANDRTVRSYVEGGPPPQR